jgi:CxxC motif-containing protein (DUF1111 family)
MKAALSVWALVALGLSAWTGCGESKSAGREPAVTSADPNLGGDTTVFDDGDEAYNYPASNLTLEQRGPFQIGDGVFNRNWVTAPATPQGNDGLGPTFNALSCSGCHPNNGRGAPPASHDEPFVGLLLRLSIPGTNEHGGPVPVPNYGDQLNHRAILGVPPEGKPSVAYEEKAGAYGDGEAFSLRVPTYSVVAPNFGPLLDDVLVSPRVAPVQIGLGLLQAVSEETILGFAAENGGHPNHVWDVAQQKTALGRFGWKANQPTAEQQTLGAFLGDIGITSTLFPTKNCPAAQKECLAAHQSMNQPNLVPIEARSMIVHALAIAVPARRALDDEHALHGETLFTKIGCAACHIPTMTTGTLDDWPQLSDQIIWPYTDLLLHDMGPDLADGRPDFEASGSEWRTAPLWGVGLIEAINDHTFLLHDGRARGFAEAILWHGGQATDAREAFRTLKKDDRDDVVAFLRSL